MIGASQPQLALSLLDLVVETMDIPQRDEVVKRIRSITGMKDPDADPNEVDPEAEQKAAADAAAQEMQRRAAEAEILEKEGRAAKAQAEAQEKQAQLQKLFQGIPEQNLDALIKALQAAQQITENPATAQVADQVLKEAGFADQYPTTTTTDGDII